MSTDIIHLKVNNWEKHQPSRKDVVHSSWFKMQNRVLEDPKLMSLDASGKLLWIYLLCLASQSNSSAIMLLPGAIEKQINCRRFRTVLLLERLQELRMVTILSRNVHVTPSIEESRIEERREEKKLPKERKVQKRPEIEKPPADATASDDACHAQGRMLPVQNAPRTLAKNDAQENLRPVVAAYVNAFKKRYGTTARPDLGGKSQGALKRLLKDYGTTKLSQIVTAFVEMDDEWFKKKCHDIITLENSVHKVVLAITTGNKDPTVDRYKTIDELLREKHGDL